MVRSRVWRRPRDRSAQDVGGEGEEGDVTGTLQRRGQPPLVPGAGAGDAAGEDLPPLRQVAPEPAHLLVVDVVDSLRAEAADLATRTLLHCLPSNLGGGDWPPGRFRAGSERDLVGIDVADGRLVGERRLLAGAGRAGAGAPGVQELDLGGHHFRAAALLAVLTLPGAGLEPTLDVDQGPLSGVLGRDLGQVALAQVPDHDVVEVGELPALAVGA